MKRVGRQYADLYTWSHALGTDVLVHQDGSCSLMIEWAGLDVEMLTEAERALAWSDVYRALAALGVGYCAEFHWWREWDRSVADAYLAAGTKMVRGQALAQPLRAAHAEHLAAYGMANRVSLVVTALPAARRWFVGAKRALIDQAKQAAALRERAHGLMRFFRDARVVPTESYCARIQQSFDRDGYRRGALYQPEPHLLVSEQMVCAAPKVVDHHIHCRRDDASTSRTKVLLAYLYPDATPGWFAGLSALSVPMHVVQIVLPLDTRAALRAAERETDLAQGTLSRRGRDGQLQTAVDLEGFRTYVAEHNLGILKNAFVIHLHGDSDQLRTQTGAVIDWFEGQGGQVRGDDFVQLPYFRATQPGQGYLAPIFRPDHAWQVAHMAPVQVYRAGAAEPESLRLGETAQLIGFNLTEMPVSHSFTVAITGDGKGVDKVATILETYPFGIDWYIAEIGGSYQWVVETLGGVYSKIDPDETVVNPLPPYAVADPLGALPLDAVLAGGTVNALSFLLTDGRTQLDTHETAAAQSALQLLYAVPRPGQDAPTLADYLTELEQFAFESDPQRRAAHLMAANIHSFLDTAEGRLFSRQDNLVLSPGITGVDLKEVDRASPKLLKFYLVFLALRFNHLAFANRSPASVLLDEMHKFVAIAPEVIGRLISELARMGRKDGAAIDIVTQGIAEIDVIEKEVINSMPLRSLLYRSDEWDAIAARINMPAGPLGLWKSFPYPLNLPWRPGLQSVGPEYYQLHLTFPDVLLDLSASSPHALDLKDRIGRETADPLERLRRFREATQMRRAS